MAAAEASSSLVVQASSTSTSPDNKPPRSSYPSAGGGFMDKRVLVMYTGGTMGMLPKADGSLDVSPGFFTTLFLKMEEMRHPGLPHIDILEYDHLMDSACMGPSDWGKFAGDIERHYFDYDGFVLVHGTDTMAYTASALVRKCVCETLVGGWLECGSSGNRFRFNQFGSIRFTSTRIWIDLTRNRIHGAIVACTFVSGPDGFARTHIPLISSYNIRTCPNRRNQAYMLENLGKPVILTGSQIPLAEVYTDAQQNLKLSIIFAAAGEFNEVKNDQLMMRSRLLLRLSTSTQSASPNQPNQPN